MSYIFIDESGDAGFKFDEGSSRFFVIAAVVFDDALEAEKTSVAIKELKRKLGLPDDVEFKFNKSSKNTRVRFLKTINNSGFKVQCLTVDKSAVKDNKLKNEKNSFYAYAIKTLLKYSRGSIVNAKIVLDGGGDRMFKRNLSSYLKKELNQGDKKIIRNLKLIDSRENMLIQLADMIAGSLRRSHESRKNDKDAYKKIFRKHIENEWGLG